MIYSTPVFNDTPSFVKLSKEVVVFPIIVTGSEGGLTYRDEDITLGSD